jgi:hypothetical protein
MRPLAFASLVTFAAALAGATASCAPLDEPELLRVTSLSPDRVAAGAEFRVNGEGFPIGREGQLHLEGECRAPGASSRRVYLDRPLQAVSSDEATLRVDAALVRRVGGRASCRFDGLVRFSGPERGVVGRFRDVQLDFMETGRDRLVTRLSDRERGLHVATRLGLAFADEMPESGGLTVASVSAASVAGRAGIEPGDVVLAIDGLRLYELADFVPTPGFQRTSLDVRDEPSGRVHTVFASTYIASDAPTASAVGYALLALLALFVFAFLAPTARAVEWLAQRPPRDPEATLAWLFGASTSGTETSRRARMLSNLVVALGVVGMSATFAAIALIGRLLEHDFGVGILLSASLALRMAARVFGESSDTEHGPLLPFFVASTPLTIAVAAIGVLVGTGHLGELHAAQGVAPWRWLVFAQPIAFGLFPVFAATALTRIEPAGTQSSLAKVAARAHLLVVSCLGAALFLGGWACPANATPFASAFGVVSFVVKAWCLIGLGLWARSVTPGAGTNAWKWTVPVAALGLFGACAWTYADLPASVERASGFVLAISAALVVVYVVGQRVRKEREPVLVLHPFL